MKLFEGKTKAERNKTIAAIVLGVLCIVVFYFAFLRGLFGGSTPTATAKPSPTATPSTSASTADRMPVMPSQQDQFLFESSTPVFYNRASFGAPDAGRNIFAFYEPPPPCRDCPTPTPPPVYVPPQTPAPTPPIQIAVLNPQSVYAGSDGVRIEVVGDNFTPDTRVYFDQQQLPTSFVNGQRLTADLPSVLIRNDGRKVILAQTGDGKLYSNPVSFEIQAAPKPQMQYIGMIARKRGNNDTAYFQEANKQLPTAARLNDIVGGRFRLVSISEKEVIFQDVNLGFRHPLPIHSPPPPAAPPPGQGVRPSRGGFQNSDTYIPYTPPAGQPARPTNSRIPGIPDSVPRYEPPPSNSNSVPRQTKVPANNDDQDN